MPQEQDRREGEALRGRASFSRKAAIYLGLEPGPTPVTPVSVWWRVVRSVLQVASAVLVFWIGDREAWWVTVLAIVGLVVFNGLISRLIDWGCPGR